MNPVHLNRLCTLDTLMCLKKCLQFSVLRSCSSSRDRKGYHSNTGLDAVVSSISSHMTKHGTIETDLLVLDNPASGEVVTKFEKAGVKKIACTIKHEDHFSNIQEQLPWSDDVFHYDLLRRSKRGTMKVSGAVEKEEEILASVGNISGLVILASGVSDEESLAIHRNLLNRAMIREADGFNSLQKIDWFCALSERSVKMKKHLQSSHTVIKLLNSFYEHQNSLTIKYDDTCSIFHNCIDSKITEWKGVGVNRCHPSENLSDSGVSRIQTTSRQRSKTKIVKYLKKLSSIKQNDVCFVHFMPKFDVLQQFSLDERQAYKSFMLLINGPQRLIPALEKLIPGCGLGLIELGYGMADEVNQIPHDQLLQVYKDVKSLPEYEGSALHHLITGGEVQEEVADHFDIMGQWWQKRDRK